MRAPLALLVALLLQSPAALLAPEPPVQVAANTWLIRPLPMPGRGPDGNTIIYDAPDGLVVVDTGRHSSQTDAILAFAREHKKPISVIVNTHWHLDHAAATDGSRRRSRMRAYIQRRPSKRCWHLADFWRGTSRPLRA